MNIKNVWNHHLESEFIVQLITYHLGVARFPRWQPVATQERTRRDVSGVVGPREMALEIGNWPIYNCYLEDDPK